ANGSAASVASAAERALGTKPILPLFLQYAGISLLGVLAQIAMVVSEGVVVGNGIGARGLACMSVVMTFEIINLSFGSSFGQGVSTVCGNLLGAGDEEGARRAFGQGFWLTFLTACTVAASFFVFTPVIIPHIGATPDIFDDTVVAVRIFMVGYPFCITGQMLCQMLRQDEHPGLASGIQTFGSVVAATWLVVSVFVLKLGIAGAAAYYAISTALWFLAIWPFLGRRGTFYIKLSDIGFTPKFAIQVCRYGCPIFLVQISSAVYVAFMNGSLGAGGDTECVASFAIINSYFMYTLNIVCMALAYALQPIVAYNMGACHNKRLAQLMVDSIVVEVLIIGVISLMTSTFAPQLCLVFTGGDAGLAEMSAGHVRIVLMFCALGFTGQMMSAYFESIGSTWRALLFGIMRYALFAVPIIAVINSVAGMDHVWWALPIADVLTFAITVAWAAFERRALLGAESRRSA
ncbi:MAG: MATE family efflux transporter, partial [Collinsella sp.]|nr:MATE family efflux transporter [Collinsella sp.]